MIAIQRVTILANTTTPITPPRIQYAVTVGNAGSQDLTVYGPDGPDLAAQSLVIASGYERAFPPIPLTERLFSPGVVAFYLRAGVETTVVLLWC